MKFKELRKYLTTWINNKLLSILDSERRNILIKMYSPTPIWDDRYRSTDNSTTTYTQNYAYDKSGKILVLPHSTLAILILPEILII